MTEAEEPALDFEELVVGATFGTPSVAVTAEEVRGAARYHPQPFHLDEAAPWAMGSATSATAPSGCSISTSRR